MRMRPLDRSRPTTSDDQPEYLARQRRESDDWSGTNAGGSDVTWHIPAMAHADSTTTITPAFPRDHCIAGTFSYQITTIASSLSEPLQHGSFFPPGVNTSVGGVFTIDQAGGLFDLGHTTQPAGDSNIAFSSFSDGVLLLKGHSGSIPRLITMSGGTISGRVNTRSAQGRTLDGPSGLPPGVNQ